MEGTLIDDLTDRERSTALRPKHIKKDKIPMKSTGYPPPKSNNQNSSNLHSLTLRKFFKPTAISLLVASTALPLAYASTSSHLYTNIQAGIPNSPIFSSATSSAARSSDPVIDKAFLENDGNGNPNGTSFREDFTASGIDLPDLLPPSGQGQIAVGTEEGATLTVNGDTLIHSQPQPGGTNGTIGLLAGATAQGGKVGHMVLNGDVDIIIQDSDGTDSDYGANGVYAGKNSTITLGQSADNRTRIFVIADKSDAISAKWDGSVTFNSVHNQVIGAIDFIEDIRRGSQDTGDYITNLTNLKSKVSGTFSGSDSFWFGDDNSFANVQEAEGLGNPFYEAGFVFLCKNGGIHGLLDLTFENGAQWTYLGNQSSVTEGSMTLRFDPKRISNITLQNGGIINLYDDNIREFCDEMGLTGYITHTDHDYVRIGHLNGSGGVFRIDVNGEDKSRSDLIFIEDAETGQGGTHHIQIEGMDTLSGITADNTLVFAVVSKNAADEGVRFHEVENVEGDKLFNYELDIRERTVSEIGKNNLKERDEFQKNNSDVEGSQSPADILDDFSNRDSYWEIYRVVRSNSASTLGMIGSGYAGYDLAVDMDRRDRRIHESVHENGSEQGLWVRVSHGQKGASGVYKNDVDTVTLGFEGAPSTSWRLGGWFSYATGDVDYSNVRGTADLERYEAAVYGTYLSGNHYLDLVGRFGRVANEFDVTSNSGALRTTGDYDQDYAAISAEYGYTLRDAATGFFLEPQLQVQATYLRDFDYSTERGMRVHADDETSVIGRTGFRFGRQFRSNESTGEAYLRGDVLHQFTDGQSATLKADADRISTTWGDKDTWANFGVGAFWNWKDRFSLQLDLERAVGGETVDTWLMSGHARYYF